jgi:hypothetical protein
MNGINVRQETELLGHDEEDLQDRMRIFRDALHRHAGTLLGVKRHAGCVKPAVSINYRVPLGTAARELLRDLKDRPMPRKSPAIDHGEFVSALVDGGDWACAHALHGGLIAVCLRLRDLLGPVQALQAARIADTIPVDQQSATKMWSRLSLDLRSSSYAR